MSVQHAGSTRIFVNNCCVGAASGVTMFKVPQGLSQSAHVSEVGDVEVVIVALDDYARANGINTVALMKLDVEGFEPEVLKGAESLLREARIKAIFTEVSAETLSRAGFDAQAYLEQLRSFDYETFYCRDEDYAAGRPPPSQWFELEVGGDRLPVALATEVPSDCHTDVLAVHKTLLTQSENSVLRIEAVTS
jgi:hypothetical protein